MLSQKSQLISREIFTLKLLDTLKSEFFTTDVQFFKTQISFKLVSSLNSLFLSNSFLLWTLYFFLSTFLKTRCLKFSSQCRSRRFEKFLLLTVCQICNKSAKSVRDIFSLLIFSFSELFELVLLTVCRTRMSECLAVWTTSC